MNIIEKYKICRQIQNLPERPRGNFLLNDGMMRYAYNIYIGPMNITSARFLHRSMSRGYYFSYGLKIQTRCPELAQITKAKPVYAGTGNFAKLVFFILNNKEHQI